MIQNIMRDVEFLKKISEPATAADAAVADDLLETRETLADLMVRYTGQDKDEALRVMDEETTFDADEAVKWGIADSIVDRM